MPSRSAEYKKPLRYVYIATVGILILAIGLASMVWNQIVVAAQVRTALTKAYNIKAISLQLLSDLSYAETAQRGYVLTGQAMFLKPYDELRGNLQRQIDTLTGTQLQDSEASQQAAALAKLTHERLEELSLIIQLSDKHGFDAAAKQVAAGRGQHIMEEIRALSSDLLRRQETSISTLAVEQRDRVASIRITMALLVLGIIVLAMSTAWLIAAYLRQREAADKKVRASMARQMALFEGALDAIIIADNEGNIESINAAAQRMFGVNPGDIAGRSFSTLTDEKRLDRKFMGIRDLADGRGHVIELTAVRRSGDMFPAELALSEIDQDGTSFYIAAFRDITDRKRADQAQREFISTVSHELRTPLTSISGALKLFVHTSGKGLSPEALRLVEIAERNTQRLAKLVNDILDIDKLEAGKMVFTDANVILEDIIDGAVEAISPFAQDNGVIIEFAAATTRTPLHVDSLRLSQALTNLLSNAIKFSPSGSMVEIRTALHDTHIRIAVTDQGPGIPDDFIPHVFSKFSQASTPGLMYKGGTGLGLSIVEQIVERLGGRVHFETSPSGTTFYIDLPFHSSDAQA